MPTSLDAFLSPVAFSHPDRLEVSGWVEHIPFAFWLIEKLAPQSFVELGTHRGTSYLAFCQAVEATGLHTRCYAIDTWQGDEHAGFYGDDVYQALSGYHDQRYGAFSRLIRSTFDEALPHFPDASIDLLHIDGLHSYEAVKHDYENWLPKMSSRGVVIFHDTNVHERNFGVARLWQELSACNPNHFLFLHGNGLGVLGVGQAFPPALQQLFAAGSRPETTAQIRAMYARLGETYTLSTRLAGLGAAYGETVLTAQRWQAQAEALEAQVAARTQERDLYIAETDALIAARDSLLAERDTLIGVRDSVSAARDALILERDTLLSERNTAISERDRLASERASLTAERDALATRVRDTETSLAETRTRLAAILVSRSWRMTAPMRAISARLRGTAHRIPGLALVNRGRKAAQRWWEGRLLLRSGLFDGDWYCRTYPDVAAARIPPHYHYLMYGADERRNPNPFFSTGWYLNRYPDVRATGINPLLHYVRWGAAELRDPHPSFNTASYIEQNPELRESGENPLRHFLRSRQPLEEFRPGFVDIDEIDEPEGDDRYALLGKAVEAAAALMAQDHVDWDDYARLKGELANYDQARSAQIAFKPAEIITLAGGDLRDCARALLFPEPADPLVSIIIPVFNEIRMTLECLSAVLRHSGGSVPYEIIVADDCSTDETPSLLAEIANIRIIRNSSNLNFLRNCNNAAEAARGKYLLFLNNDVQVAPGWLEALTAPFLTEAGIGAVGPKILYPDGRLQEAGAALNRDGSATLIGHGDDPLLPQYNRKREVDYCSGACLLVEADRFRQLGGFTEALAPAYYEDADLCLKLRRAGLRVLYNPAAVIHHHLSRTTAAADSRFKTRCVVTNRQKILEKWQAEIDALNDVRLIAFYLPQYHPIPENDRWWGKGFTEWRNVTRARPNFVGHYQPRLPADFGYYDLRVPEAMEAQAELAQKYGIFGFCYYYYWFAGKRLLELPIERLLATGRPDFPFCLCWANENWTRRWDGQDKEILIAQDHSEEDDIAVITDLIRYFRSPRYIRIDGKPLLLIYQVQAFGNFARTARTWREVCRKQGIGEIYLAMVETFSLSVDLSDPAEYNCDAAVEFPPHGLLRQRKTRHRLIRPEASPLADDYREVLIRYATRPQAAHTRFHGVMPSWDNTPRRQDHGMCLENSSPGAFQAWLETAIRQTREKNFGEERMVFINAWNEWAEGAYLEPDRRYGHAWLEAVRNAREHWQLAGNRTGA